MNLKDQLSSDLKQALKAGNQSRADLLRLINASIHNKEIEKRTKTGNPELSEEEIIQVLSTEAKKRREASEIFMSGNRSDLREKEENELVIIKDYLPKQLSPEEVQKAIDQIFEQSSPKDFGQAMKTAMQELKGKADAKLIAEIIHKKLAG